MTRDRGFRVFPPARRGQSVADDRARIRQSLSAARRGRAVGAGDRRRRQHRHAAAVRARQNAEADARARRGRRCASAIKTIGLFNTKAKNVIALSEALVRDHGGEVPRTREELQNAARRRPQDRQRGAQHRLRRGDVRGRHPRLPRRATAPASRPARPLDEVEAKLEKIVPQPFRRDAHHWLILHGRYTCKARLPECWRCPVIDLCRYQPKTPPPGERAKPKGARTASPNRSAARTATSPDCLDALGRS